MTLLRPIELDVEDNTQQIDLDIGDNTQQIDLDFQEINYAGGTNDYNKLINKPKINGHTVEGDKLGADYELQDLMQDITAQEIDDIIFGG